MIEEFFVHLLASLTEHVLPHIHPKFLKLKIMRRDQDARVAFAAILRVRTAEQQYLLVQSLHRPESYAPFGGVYKYYHSANDLLDTIEFRPQAAVSDMKADLRGFLPRKHVLTISQWFQTGSGRESYTECLRRELLEELAEAKISGAPCPSDLQFTKVRTVWEGPEPIVGETYAQLRIFDVCDISPSSGAATAFIEHLTAAARQQAKRKTKPTLLLVNDSEIRKGRAASGAVIGHPAGYLFSTKRLRPDGPTFATPQHL